MNIRATHFVHCSVILYLSHLWKCHGFIQVMMCTFITNATNEKNDPVSACVAEQTLNGMTGLRTLS